MKDAPIMGSTKLGKLCIARIRPYAMFPSTAVPLKAASSRYGCRLERQFFAKWPPNGSSASAANLSHRFALSPSEEHHAPSFFIAKAFVATSHAPPQPCGWRRET
eukprot:scaffold1638_cov258-Pinguiococcus_pyrenoidosus.AAC.81